jgi:hydrogenase nickel incorporation protein HypA/HybF
VHEMAIAVELMDQLDALAEQHALTRIESVSVAAGALRGIVPEALDAAFAALKEGTRAAEAKLELEIIPVEALCRHCGERFAPGANDFLCPRCERADVEIIAGDEIVLSSVSGERNGGDVDEDQRCD